MLELYVYVYIYTYIHDIPGTQMNSIFEGQPPKTRPFQSKQGSFGFQVYSYLTIFAHVVTPVPFQRSLGMKRSNEIQVMVNGILSDFLGF